MPVLLVMRTTASSVGLAFIQKPFTPDLLARKVQEVLGGGTKPS